MFPKILESTFPIASEEPGPGASRCPGSPQPTTPLPPPNRNEASRPRGHPCGLRGSCLLGAGARTRRSLRHHRPHNLASPLAAPPGPCVCARRAAALLRRGRPGTALPPAGAARAPPRCPLLRLLFSPPRDTAALWLARRSNSRAHHRPRPPESVRLRRLVRSLILAGTRCSAYYAPSYASTATRIRSKYAGELRWVGPTGSLLARRTPPPAASRPVLRLQCPPDAPRVPSPAL